MPKAASVLPYCVGVHLLLLETFFQNMDLRQLG